MYCQLCLDRHYGSHIQHFTETHHSDSGARSYGRSVLQYNLVTRSTDVQRRIQDFTNGRAQFRFLVGVFTVLLKCSISVSGGNSNAT